MKAIALFIPIFMLSIGLPTNLLANDNEKSKRVVLRQIGGYCDRPNDNFTCLPYNNYDFPEDSVNQYIAAHSDKIEELVIENPSNIIYEIKFKHLTKLRVLEIFGNDYDTDALESFPKKLLKLPKLEMIVFDGVRFPSKVLKEINEKYPNLVIDGEISEY